MSDYLRRGFVQSPGGNIEYRETGTGAPLLLLHMTPFSSVYFAGVLPLLARVVRAIALTTPGYGASDRPPQPYTTMEQFASSVVRAMDGLGLDRAHLLGTHTGAQLALEVAARHPERVQRLVLEEPFNWNAPHRREIHLRTHLGEHREDGGHLADLWRRMAGPARTAAERDEARQLVLDVLTANLGPGVPEYGDRSWEVAAPWAINHQETWEMARRVEAPALIIHGQRSELGRAHDRFLESMRAATGWRPDVPGRSSWREAPPGWSRAIIDFVEGR